MNDSTANAGMERANILVVDDRPDKLLVYKTMLEDLGQNVLTATSGDEALKQVLERDFALILLDVNMPGLDGLETAALIRGRKKSAHTPIMLITSDYGDEPRIRKAYSLGAVDYISSPVVPEILRAKVNVFVELHLLAEQAKRQAQERIALVEEKAAREAAERASRRLAFLAEASGELASSLDLEATLRAFLGLVVPRLADVGLLSISAVDGQLDRHEMVWSSNDPEHPLLTASLLELGSPLLEKMAQRVRESGKPETIERDASDEAARIDLPRGLSVHTLMIVPLLVRGRRLGVLSLGLDATDRRFDADAVAMVADLATRGATALDNALLFRKIQDEDQRKNEFLAMLAHELRNPLAPISNAVHILRVSETDSVKVAWARDLIGRQLKQLVRLVDDLLDVSRITRGKIELKMETVDVAQVVAAAIETSRPNIDAQRHTLSLQLPVEALALRGDFARVAQILSNLVNNAAKYTPKGGRISLSAARDGDEVVFRIRDSGIGIPPEFIASIFDPFTQADRTLARSHGGLGIGLTLVRRLVEMQQGRVSVRSEGRNRGSEFTVHLPVATDAGAATDLNVASAGDDASPAGLRVLVVDDNRDVADSTASIMRMNGCDVHVVYDGRAAIESVQRLRPDAVLLDIGLPAIDGYLVAEHIRAQPENGRTMIVAVSGYGQEQDRLRSKSVGFDYHVVKPIDPAVLAGLVGSLRVSRDAARTGVPAPVPLSDAG
ncbi:MAG TPA: response regulator [Kofleriaceae bacterium]|jgi:signal transduction histidine kinase/DNA-binding response OmpR family regulator|nr:response regulator [Kofleriaceae bacterium]